MDPALIVLLILLGLMVFAWLVEKFAKPTASEPSEQKDDSTSFPQKTRIRRKRSIVRRQEQEDVFPDYDPSHNDESEWRSIVEKKFRKYPGRPPDWQRRRVLVFLRDGGRCQSKEHRGGTCGRLLCEPNQIWNFPYDVRLLVDADVDHIKPLSAGGDNDLANLQLLCARCHNLKHPGNSKLSARVLPRLVPRGRGRKKFLQKYFFTRKAPKPPDEDVPF
jgi:5-methylcytosine-specific restriction endonuclease McrA